MRHGDGSGGEDKRIVFISAGGEAQRAALRRKVSLFSSSFMNLRKPLGHSQGRSYVVANRGCGFDKRPIYTVYILIYCI